MTERITLGWDIGGAHLKAAWLDAGGRPQQIYQQPCPLWRGTSVLTEAITAIQALLPRAEWQHALTMTGELVDGFSDRNQGVQAILQAFQRSWPGQQVWIFGGRRGWLLPDRVDAEAALDVASANWLATAHYLAQTEQDGIVLDIGSTTTDIIPFQKGEVTVNGFTDDQRLRCQELVYTGVVRTPVMALTRETVFAGETSYVMAELFANMADVYRLLALLPDQADQFETCDGGDKTSTASAVRLLRMLGLDYRPDLASAANNFAIDLKNRQKHQIRMALLKVLSRQAFTRNPTLIGAGVGRFLARELALEMALPYHDFMSFWPESAAIGLHPADCAPAVAVAALAVNAFPEKH